MRSEILGICLEVGHLGSGLDLLVGLSELGLSFVCENPQQPESQNKL